MTADQSLFGPNNAIKKSATFIHVLGGTVPAPGQSFDQILAACDDALRDQRGAVSQSALNNAHGDWYEWLIAVAAWNFHAENPTSFIALPLPNVTAFDVASLYAEPLYGYVQDLRSKVAQSAAVQLITSNPDFVIIDLTHLEAPPELQEPITEISAASLHLIRHQYAAFIGRCRFNDIRGYAAVKRSLRPDRRLQIPHEGSLMKALYRHLQTRLWVLNPRGIMYYALTSIPGVADQQALQTVATHSITTVLSTPERAVDRLFAVNSGLDAIAAFHTMLFESPTKSGD